jgi:hypothetical protein
LVLLPSSRFWEIWTNREVVAHGRGRIDREGLTAITSHVDEAYYGEEGPSEEDVRRIETGAEDTHRELTSTSAPTSEAEDDPPLR